jgi:hypothetical protein
VPNPTTFFLSSSAQDSLTDIRNTAYTEIRELGHNAEMYEKTFGPWPSFIEGARHCIEKVKECDVFCLFIHNKAGTMLDSGRTITHLEFMEAINQRKVLLLFADRTIKQQYFTAVKWVIKDFLGKYRADYNRNPSYKEISEFLEAESRKNDSPIPAKQAIEPYVWVFLYDIIDVHQKYVDDLSMGVGIRWKQYLSDLLRQGVELIPRKKEALESMDLAQEFGDFSDFSIHMMKFVTIKDLNLKRILVLLRETLSGAVIVNDFHLTKAVVGKVKRCSAICVFRRSERTLKNICSDGDTGGDKDFDLKDSSSFVAITYNNFENEEPALFYIESKRMFYLTYKVGEYVISYHFPVESEWNQQMFEDYNETIIDGIMDAHANSMVFDYINTVLGGLQR